MFTARLEKEKTIIYDFKTKRRRWVQLVKGKMKVNENFLEIGDGPAITEIPNLKFEAIKGAEFLFFDLK